VTSARSDQAQAGRFARGRRDRQRPAGLDGLESETWAATSGIQRCYLRMPDMETTDAAKPVVSY